MSIRFLRDITPAVINKTGSPIAANKIVALTTLDVTSGRPKIVLADADVANHDNLYITTEAIPDGGSSVVYKGRLSPATLDTSGATTAGDAVYLSTTAGAFTHTAPTGASARVIEVGYVVVKSSTVGQIAWFIQDTTKVGSDELQDASITPVKLAAGTAASVAYPRTSTGALTLLAAVAFDRAVVGVIDVTTTFAAGDGAAPSFIIGETGSTSKFLTAKNTGTAGDKISFAGILTANTALLVTATAATGSTSAGALKVTAITARN